MRSIYTNGDYLQNTQTWHSEDSPWKADQIYKIIQRNNLSLNTIAEIGCGVGLILEELSRKQYFRNMSFYGYDISPQAIELAKKRADGNVEFFCKDILSDSNSECFDVLLLIDVFEHVADYMDFLKKCKIKAEYKIFHIPLDIHVSSILRNSFMEGRYTVGHLHYFTADSAIATLKDTGYEILDYFYTNAAFGLFRQHPSFKRALANVPRYFLSRFSTPFTARMLGGYSLLVLAK
jgi:SAM-dependent methyltransferase